MKAAEHFDESVGHLYEVTLKAMVELAFDETPDEKDLRAALLDNAIYYLTDVQELDEDWPSTEDNLTYEHIDEVALL